MEVLKSKTKAPYSSILNDTTETEMVQYKAFDLLVIDLNYKTSFFRLIIINVLKFISK